jgi:hypothetical protein
MTLDAADSASPTLLVKAILDPRTLRKLDPQAWERLLSCARRNAVLAYLGERAVSADLIVDLPNTPRMSLLAARTAATRLAQLARWELDRVRRALQPVGIPMIALKGVAYIVRGDAARGDAHSVRHRRHGASRPHRRRRSRALAGGWKGTKLDPYDQRYYRRWSHEIPPLSYPGRLLGVDVHHTICPPRSRLRPDPARFWADAELAGDTGVRVLSPVDSVLHSAAHLFFDSDFDGRFRDLVDLHELLAAFGKRAEFWPALIARAREQKLGRPLYYAFATLSTVLRTPIPAETLRDARAFKPDPVTEGWMRKALEAVLTPIDPARWPPAHRGRLWLLYVRSHWLRIPAYALVPHLLRKSVRRGAEDAAGP